MPCITSIYTPPFFFRQADIATIYSGKIRRVKGVVQSRERMELPDGDFLNLDWSYSTEKTNRCIILLHGLEGSAKRPYILGTAKLFNQNGYDACAMNFRGCGGEPNRLFSTYHSAKTDDLEAVVGRVLELGYTQIVIKGFSMGGNIALKYAGTHTLPPQVKAIIGVSVPCDLKGASLRLVSSRNWLYANRFLRTLIAKAKEKQRQFPTKISLDDIQSVRNLRDFDNIYTSKAHGFKDADDYYKQCSSLPNLKNLQVPTLLLNAKNDSFLSVSCFPYEIAENHPFLYLETPNYGGHVAFYDTENIYYNEKRALAFCQSV